MSNRFEIVASFQFSACILISAHFKGTWSNAKALSFFSCIVSFSHTRTYTVSYTEAFFLERGSLFDLFCYVLFLLLTTFASFEQVLNSRYVFMIGYEQWNSNIVSKRGDCTKQKPSDAYYQCLLSNLVCTKTQLVNKISVLYCSWFLHVFTSLRGLGSWVG